MLCSAGAASALSHVLNGGACFSFLTLKANHVEHQLPIQLLAVWQQPTWLEKWAAHGNGWKLLLGDGVAVISRVTAGAEVSTL